MYMLLNVIDMALFILLEDGIDILEMIISVNNIYNVFFCLS